jgi:hypothetical protein
MSILDKLTKKQKAIEDGKKSNEEIQASNDRWEAKEFRNASAAMRRLLHGLDGHLGIDVKFFATIDQYGSFATVVSKHRTGTIHVVHEDGTFRGSDESPSQDTRDLHIYMTTQCLNGPREFDHTAYTLSTLIERVEEDLINWLVRDY